MISLHLEFKSLEEALPILKALTVAGSTPANLKSIVEKYNTPSPAEIAQAATIEKEPAQATIKTEETVKADTESGKKSKGKTAENKDKQEPQTEQVDATSDFDLNTNEEGEAVTHDTVKARVQKIIKADATKKAKVIELLKKVGADSIPKIKTEDLAKFDKLLDKIK